MKTAGFPINFLLSYFVIEFNIKSLNLYITPHPPKKTPDYAVISVNGWASIQTLNKIYTSKDSYSVLTMSLNHYQLKGRVLQYLYGLFAKMEKVIQNFAYGIMHLNPFFLKILIDLIAVLLIHLLSTGTEAEYCQNFNLLTFFVDFLQSH